MSCERFQTFRAVSGCVCTRMCVCVFICVQVHALVRVRVCVPLCVTITRTLLKDYQKVVSGPAVADITEQIR